MGSTIVKDRVIAMNVEIVLLLVGRLVNLGMFRFLTLPPEKLLNRFLFKSLPDLHPCTRACHAPSTCPETEPCESLITLSCPCGRIRQSVLCGHHRSSGHGHNTAGAPKCSNDCLIAKRNARLADALGISVESRDKSGAGAGATAVVTYSDELVGFARINLKFLSLVEKTLAE